MKAKRSERGQVLVIIILVIVGMIGFAALAIDGGQVYAERRRAQNAADAAAYKIAFSAANNPKTSESELLNMAYSLTKENGFFFDTSVSPADQKLNVEYYHPPKDGVYKGNPEYYQVFITTEVKQGFSHMVFNGTAALTVESVARARPSSSLSPGDALHATSKTASPALEFDGAGGTLISGGNAFSNSNTEVSGKQNGSGGVTVEAPHNIEVAGLFVKKGGSGTVSPDPLDKYDGVTQKSIPGLPTPDCYTDMAARSVPKNGSTTLQPGRYDTAESIHNGDWTMSPGMYCFMNGFKFNGGSLTGKDVFIYVKQGGLDFSGNGSLTLKRPNDLKDGTGNPKGNGNQWGGMLFYVAGGDVKISGGSSTQYTGTMYAPNSECSIGGNAGSIGLSSNVVCETIKVHGNANVVVNYLEPQNFRVPPMIELSQ